MPDPTTFLYKLASAIASAEGFFVSNSLPSRFNNPGDLRAAPASPGTTQTEGFVKFSNPGFGIAALYHQLSLDIARGWSLRKLVYTYAPPSDGNNTSNYLNETGRRIGLDASQFDTPLYDFLAIHLIP